MKAKANEAGEAWQADYKPDLRQHLVPTAVFDFVDGHAAVYTANQAGDKSVSHRSTVP